MRLRHQNASVRALAVVATAALLISACGSDDDDGAADTTAATEAPADTTGAAEEPADTAAAAEEPADTAAAAEEPADTTATAEGDCAGTTDNSAGTGGSADDPAAAGAGAAGSECELPTLEVGYLQWIYADEAGKRIEDAARDAVEWAGWSMESCDAAGDPAQMPVCGNQLLDMGVDMLMTDGIPEEFITDVLERAAEEGVAVVSGGGEVDPRNFYDAAFASDDTDMGVQLAEWVKAEHPDGAQMLVQTFPAAWSAKRVEGLEQALEGSNVEIIDTWEADPTNLVDGTNADVTTKLQQFPETDVIWINFSVASIGAAQAVGALPEGERPQLVTFYANPSTVADINAGRIDAAVDESLEWQSWAGADALMQLAARGQTPSTERAPDFNGVNMSARQVVDILNAPADGVAPMAAVDYETFFKAKWCTEFPGLPNC
jgi:hypothetical protein